MRPAALALVLLGCTGDWEPHGPAAEGIYAPLGQPLPSATAEQRETFARGREVAEHRFALEEGLGPAFNVTFCAACHEKPDLGGGAGLYRNFFLAGRTTSDGAFFFAESAGNGSGVIRVYNYNEYNMGDLYPARPEVPDTTTIVAQRNPIPFFGVGLIAELSNDEILKRADPDDEDGDGISGRPNWDRGFVGRFGMKAQTVSIEGFIRGPLMNHLGITSNPLTDEERARLPVDSSGGGATGSRWVPAMEQLQAFMQAAAPDGPLVDNDTAEDPELSSSELFDLVSWAMLLAAPEPEPLDEVGLAGMRRFDEAGCADCHTPRLEGPRGPVPAYSDLLLHDMGSGLEDGLVMKEASGTEFRTQPLWGLTAVGPYLHDGRAETIAEAIAWHGGEAAAARDAFLAYDAEERDSLLEFLRSLGGRDQRSPGLIPPSTPIAPVGDWGGPATALSDADAARFLAGRSAFDEEFGFARGVGAPRYNGDSCRACHFEPVVGGAGPLGVNVMRHGILISDFVQPSVGTILHKQTSMIGEGLFAQPDVSVYEPRQTPHIFGLGLIESIDEATILAQADPFDSNKDGISGKPSWTDGDRLGRFGWKAQIPTVDEFVRDAVHAELGMTLPIQAGLTFGIVQDNDSVPDPEFPLAVAEDLAFYLSALAGPPRTPAADPAAASAGETVFADVGCASCHTPQLDGVPLYSDLLLHEILAPGTPGIEEASATMQEFRTAPLWGVSQTGPYLHDGTASTLDQAIRGHAGEAAATVARYEGLSVEDRAALLAFLETL